MTKHAMQPGEFIELMNYLADTLDPPGGPPGGKPSCDNTLTRTIKWLRAHGYTQRQVLAVIEGIKAGGAACDCEVILNADSVGEAVAGPLPEETIN